MRVDRRSLLVGSLAVLASGAAAQTPAPLARPGRPLVFAEPDETINLWPGDAPGIPRPAPSEQVRDRSTEAT